MGKSVLFITGDYSIPTVLSWYFEEKGMDWKHVEKVRDAIQLFANNEKTDCIICDTFLQGATSIEFIDWFRTKKECDTIPVHLVTAMNIISDISQRIRGYSAIYYHQLPIDPQILAAEIIAGIASNKDEQKGDKA